MLPRSVMELIGDNFVRPDCLVASPKSGVVSIAKP